MIKILHISTIIEWRGGDAQMLTTHNLLRNKEDIEQLILCPEGSVLAKKCEDQKIRYETAERTSKFSFPFLKKILKLTKQHNIDIIHVHDSNALSLTSVAMFFLKDVKLVYSRKRNNRIKNNFFKKLKYNNKKITTIVCVSKAVKNVFKGILKNPENAHVIYDGIDIEKFSNAKNSGALRKEFAIPTSERIIGTIGGLTKQKDHYTFIDTAYLLRQYSKTSLRFIIIGDGKLKPELIAYVKEKELEDVVLFAGFRKNVPELLSEFDLLLMSSETEGLPLTILEGFAAGIPVVTTAAGGSGEAVIHKQTGMISPVKDADQLSKNVIELLENRSLKSFCIENALALVHEKFSLEGMQKNYYDLYTTIKQV